MAYRKVTGELLSEIDRACAINGFSNSKTRSWQHISAILGSCSRATWVLRDIPIMREKDGSPLYVPDVVARFYNDTVAFILGGKRDINVEVWESIHDWLRAVEDPSSGAMSGNIGTTIVKSWQLQTGTDQTDRATLTKVSATKLSRQLVNMLESDLIYMWSIRPNGIDDMIRSLPMLCRVHQHLCADAEYLG